MLKVPKIFILLTAALALAALPAHAQATIWVATDGIDGAPNTGSESLPFLTIQYAFDQAVSGDTIRVKEGTYNECVFASNPDQVSVHIVADAFLQDPGNPAARELTVIDGTGACAFPFSTVNIGGFVQHIRNGLQTGQPDDHMKAHSLPDRHNDDRSHCE